MSYRTWLAQADDDVLAAGVLLAGGHHEWACYVALQAAEKAQKAYFYALGMEPPLRQGRKGHDLVALASAWPESVRPALSDLALAAAQARLNQHAEGTRYPQSGQGSGGGDATPHEAYDRPQGEQAIEDARAIVAVCRRVAERAALFADQLGSVLARTEPR